jgi:hypothetical protein
MRWIASNSTGLIDISALTRAALKNAHEVLFQLRKQDQMNDDHKH